MPFIQAKLIPLRNKYLQIPTNTTIYLPNTVNTIIYIYISQNTTIYQNIRRVSVVFPLITLYKLCPSSRRTSNTTDTLNLYQYHGRSHTCKPNTYYSIYISLSLSLLLLLCYTATLLAASYYCLPTNYFLLLNNTPFYPLTSLYPCTTQFPINE